MVQSLGLQKIEKALNKFQTDFVEHENYSADIYVDEQSTDIQQHLQSGIHLIEVNPWGNSFL
jgi:hypothetical protein